MTDYLAQSWEDCARHVEAGGVVEDGAAGIIWFTSRIPAGHYRTYVGSPCGSRRLLPIPVTSWEQCAAHVEAGGVVEVEENGAWRPVGRVSTYRERLGSPTDPKWLPHRLIPIISAAPTPDESSTDTGEGQAQAATGEGHDSAGECSGSPATDQGGLDLDRMLDRARNDGFRVSADGLDFEPTHRIADLLNAALERIIHLEAPSALPTVPDGHEIVVLPSGVVDRVARNWPSESAGITGPIGDACREAVALRPKPAPKTERVRAMEAVEDRRKVVHPAGPFEAEAIMWIEGEMAVCEYGGPAAPIDPDGTIEVLVDGES